MFSSTRSRVGTVVGIGVVAALVVAGLALAQENGTSASTGEQGTPVVTPGGLPEGPLPDDKLAIGIAGPMTGDLTYAEFHTLKDGEAQVTRLDSGKIDSVSASEITITENDGSQVTIPVDAQTKVLAPDGGSSVTDLEQGQQVEVSRLEGAAADVIVVPPTMAELEREMDKRPENMPEPPIGARTFKFERKDGKVQGFAVPAPPPSGVSPGNPGSQG